MFAPDNMEGPCKKITLNQPSKAQLDSKDVITIDKLNDDCLREIFSYLPVNERIQIGSVCKRWQAISIPNMKALDLQFGYYSTEKPLKYNKEILSRRGNHITCVELSKAIDQFKRDLMRFYRDSRGDEQLYALVRHYCSKLLSGGTSEMLMLESGMTYFTENFCEITELHLGGWRSDFRFGDVTQFLEKANNLRILSILRLDNICIKGLHSSAIKSLKYLRKLELVDDKNVTDALLAVFGSNCHELTTVTLKYSERVTDAGLCSITSLPKLEYLSIVVLNRVIGETLSYATNLKTLKCTNCHRLDANGLLLLLQLSNKLEHLEMNSCTSISLTKFIIRAAELIKSRPSGVVTNIFIPHPINLGYDIDWKHSKSSKYVQLSPFLNVIQRSNK